MKEGLIRIQGRNRNFIDFHPEGEIILNTGKSAITINTTDIPQPPVSTPSSEISKFITPNPNLTPAKSIINEPVADVIPLYYPKEVTLPPSTEIISDTIDLFLPSTEETFTVIYDSYAYEFIDGSVIDTKEVVYRGPQFNRKGSFAGGATFLTENEQKACDRSLPNTTRDGFTITSKTRRNRPVNNTFYHGAVDIGTVEGTSIKIKIPYDVYLQAILYPEKNIEDPRTGQGSGGYGILVILKYFDVSLGENIYIYLAHLQKVSEYINNLSPNSKINQDEIIAYTGKTAWKNKNTDSHLHYEIRNDVKHLCPNNWLQYLILE